MFASLRCWLFGHRLFRHSWERRGNRNVGVALCRRCWRIIETGESFTG